MKIRYADENNPMGEWMSLEWLAEALRPLLAQPASADVPAAEPTEAEQVRYWKDAAAAARREALFSARDDVAALDARAQRAELQLADARQEIEALRQTNNDQAGQIAGLRAQLNDSNAEVDDLRARWAAIPWAALADRLAPNSLPWSDSIAVQWYRANHPGPVSD